MQFENFLPLLGGEGRGEGVNFPPTEWFRLWASLKTEPL